MNLHRTFRFAALGLKAPQFRMLMRLPGIFLVFQVGDHGSLVVSFYF
jgi:hypothetical protein